MGNLHRQGAFQGSSARGAYFVLCDSSTTTQLYIDQGIVNILVGFAGPQASLDARSCGIRGGALLYNIVTNGTFNSLHLRHLPLTFL